MGSNNVAYLLEEIASNGGVEPFYTLLRPLVDYDRAHDGDLVRTLDVYFQVHGNASEAADRLFLHRNSMLYRLNRVQTLLGLDLACPKTRLALQMALLHYFHHQEKSGCN